MFNFKESCYLLNLQENLKKATDFRDNIKLYFFTFKHMKLGLISITGLFMALQRIVDGSVPGQSK
jgi:hypothetical protein